MTWHGQINRTIWEIGDQIKREPRNFRLRKEYLRTHFLQRYELDRSLHIPRDDRSFLFMQEHPAPVCLLIHSETGTPAEMRDLGNYLYSRGLTVYCPRISRYDSKDRPISWEAWLTAAEGALTTVMQYSQDVVVVGSSLGGTVALILDELHRIKALALLAPAVYPKIGLAARLLSIVRFIAPDLYFRLAGWDGEAAKAMERVRNRRSKVTTPMIVLQARNDPVVSGRGLRFLRRIVMNERTEVVQLREGAHALTRGAVREDVFERVFGFLGKIRVMQSQSGSRPGMPARSPRPRQSPAGGGRRAPQTPAVMGEEPGAAPSNRDSSERPPRERRPRRRGRRGRGSRGRAKAPEQSAETQSPPQPKEEPREEKRRSRRRRSRSRRPRGESRPDRGPEEQTGGGSGGDRSRDAAPDRRGDAGRARREKESQEKRSMGQPDRPNEQDAGGRQRGQNEESDGNRRDREDD